MCGIAGIVSLGAPLEDSEVAEGKRMTSILRHRGPDSEGLFHDDSCLLGNTRLSIIDLTDHANLPMKNDDGSVWLAYNGEITNFRLLASEFSLGAKYSFHSTSDTEVLLHMYEEMGIDCLRHLSGMFAFCLYDRRRKKVYIVRDFYGTRPLFWMVRGDRFYFSSELKSFMELADFSPELNREAIFHYFSLAYIPGTMTPFKDVHELDGSHLIEIDLASPESVPELRAYYEIDFRPDSGMTLEEADEGFYEAILGAVERNLISDAPVGTTLSGGLDSSSVLGLARVLGKGNELHSFSLRINERSFDESEYQRVMAKYAGSIHHEIVVNPSDIRDSIPAYMAYMDEPLGDGSAIPFFLLAREARKHVKVLLSGEGGDEISNAYETHMANHVARMYRKWIPSPLRRVNRFLAGKLPVSYNKLSFDFLARRFTTGAEKSPPEAHLYYRHVLDSAEKLMLMPGSGAFTNSEAFFTDLFESLDFGDDLDRLALLDMKFFFIGDLMMKNDRMLMANSVEARFPFMDRLAVEFFTTIPSKYKIRGFTRRYIEKRAMKRVLPRKIHRRQNFGIELPYSLWFGGELSSMAKEYFNPEKVGRSGILNPDFVMQLWTDHISGFRDNGRILWCILSFLIWFELFIYEGDFRKHLSL